MPQYYRHQPPRLHLGYLAKFTQETLFYVFYSMPGDEAQILAADELSHRGWWFHKDHKVGTGPCCIVIAPRREAHDGSGCPPLKAGFWNVASALAQTPATPAASCT